MTAPFIIHHGDNREILKTLTAESIDAAISDPPYELGFMGRKWDATGIAYDVGMWREVLRVMKPGAHLVAFGGTRTYHRMACAIEDAGFEIRDQIAWTYGSGFPKSMDVSKAIDRQKGNRDEILRVTAFVREAAKAAGVTNRMIDEAFGMNGMAGHWTSSTSQPAVPTAEQWPKLLALLRVDVVPLELRDLVEKIIREKGQPGPNWFKREVTGVHDQAAPAQVWNQNFGNAADPTPKERWDKAASEEAKRWQGWGTALKPAWEPIVLARKPLRGTIATNVVKHGTGALNIDATRIPTNGEQIEATRNIAMGSSGAKIYGKAETPGVYEQNEFGRFPANLIHDGSPEVVQAFGEDDTPAPTGARPDGSESGWLFDELPIPENAICRDDPTGAARFFFCAKASGDDREAGLEEAGIQEVTGNEVTGRAPGSAGAVASAFAGTTQSLRRNIHPTVKPTALMRWLVRMITPRGGVVLDHFTGSGSTGRAAVLEGCKFVGIEQDAAHVEIARARIREAVGPLFA